jgi:hypothetical protein
MIPLFKFCPLLMKILILKSIFTSNTRIKERVSCEINLNLFFKLPFKLMRKNPCDSNIEIPHDFFLIRPFDSTGLQR